MIQDNNINYGYEASSEASSKHCESSISWECTIDLKVLTPNDHHPPRVRNDTQQPDHNTDYQPIPSMPKGILWQCWWTDFLLIFLTSQ